MPERRCLAFLIVSRRSRRRRALPCGRHYLVEVVGRTLATERSCTANIKVLDVVRLGERGYQVMMDFKGMERGLAISAGCLLGRSLMSCLSCALKNDDVEARAGGAWGLVRAPERREIGAGIF